MHFWQLANEHGLSHPLICLWAIGLLDGNFFRCFRTPEFFRTSACCLPQFYYSWSRWRLWLPEDDQLQSAGFVFLLSVSSASHNLPGTRHFWLGRLPLDKFASIQSSLVIFFASPILISQLSCAFHFFQTSCYPPSWSTIELNDRFVSASIFFLSLLCSKSIPSLD